MPGTVLVVEDEAHLAGLLRDILLASGYNVVLATPSRAAASAVAISPKAIVMDYMMPGMTGAEVAQEIRDRLDPHTPPLILVTGLPNARELAEQARADAYLRKPFDVDAFVQLLDDLSA